VIRFGLQKERKKERKKLFQSTTNIHLQHLKITFLWSVVFRVLFQQTNKDEMIKSGCDFRAVSGTVTTLSQRGYRGQQLAFLTRNSMRFSITIHSLSAVVNKILGDNCTSLDTRGNAHGGGVSFSLHQAVSWSLKSPFYNDTLHLTGVYIFPNECNLEESFDTLTAYSNHPSHEHHIYAGDFNSYTAEEIESHSTPLDCHTLFRRMGDTNPAHCPASPLTTATAPAADYRGCLH